MMASWTTKFPISWLLGRELLLYLKTTLFHTSILFFHHFWLLLSNHWLRLTSLSKRQVIQKILKLQFKCWTSSWKTTLLIFTSISIKSLTVLILWSSKSKTKIFNVKPIHYSQVWSRYPNKILNLIIRLFQSKSFPISGKNSSRRVTQATNLSIAFSYNRSYKMGVKSSQKRKSIILLSKLNLNCLTLTRERKKLCLI